MEGYSRNDEKQRQLLDLIPKEREWLLQKHREETENFSERKLELTLGPPTGDWSSKKVNGAQAQAQAQAQKFSPSFLQLHEESASKRVDVLLQQNGTEKKKVFSPPATKTGLVPNSSQKRAAPAPVVGWPPVRSFRKNIASSSTVKPASDSSQQNVVPKKGASEKPMEICQKGLFVKINMDGIPIGRKVDLKAYDSYEKLSSAVDELFRGLLAAQSDPFTGGTENKEDGKKVITGLLDGSGEYTLVYEDNEGDRMLVGDVPWQMFVSTVKRLRVLKSSDISTLTRGSKLGN